MNPIGWVEIPVTDMKRAVKFYKTVFGWELKEMDLGPLQMALFPFDPTVSGAGGGLVKHPKFYKPGKTMGSLVYFQCPDVAVSLEKIKEAGGEVLQEKKLIAENTGYMGLFIDSEGNRVALHSNQ